MPHTSFPKAGKLGDICQVDLVMMQVTSITSASQVLPVLADAAVAVAHVAPKFPGLLQSGWLCGKRCLVIRPCWWPRRKSHHYFFKQVFYPLLFFSFWYHCCMDIITFHIVLRFP